MENTILTFIISVLTAGITAVVTYAVSIKTNLYNKELELKREQAYKYFLPLKFIADELYYRLAHIENGLITKGDVFIQLPQILENKDLEWYFTDWADSKRPSAGAGGYFLITTVFMHAQLYNRINLILKEYPFLKIKLEESLESYIASQNNEQMSRCFKNAIEDEHTRKWINIKELSNLKGEIELVRLIKCIRLAAVMKGGIPYSFQTGFGQFIDKQINGKTEQINYEEFVRLLMDKEQRLKFLQLYRFYSNIIDNDNQIDELKLTKIRALMSSLLFFRNINLVI